MKRESYRNLDDAMLLELWQAGDLQAGEGLLKRYQEKVKYFFMRRVSLEYETLTQDTLTAVSRNRDRIQTSFRSYLWGTARNVFRGHIRSKTKGLDPDDESTTSERVDESWTTKQIAHENRKTLVAALRRLPLDMQSILELRVWESLTNTEIAEVLDIEPGAVRVRLHRARKKLKAAFTEVEEEAKKLATEDHRMSGWAREVRDQRADDNDSEPSEPDPSE